MITPRFVAIKQADGALLLPDQTGFDSYVAGIQDETRLQLVLGSTRFFAVKLADGLHVVNRAAYERFIAELPEREEVFLLLGPIFRNWTGNQRRYYWGVLLRDLSEYTGYTREWLHDQFIAMFYGDHVAKRAPEDSTTMMSIEEGIQYLNDIIHFWWDYAEYHVPLPDDIHHYRHAAFADMPKDQKEE
jgi:hypothetical protein